MATRYEKYLLQVQERKLPLFNASIEFDDGWKIIHGDYYHGFKLLFLCSDVKMWRVKRVSVDQLILLHKWIQENFIDEVEEVEE